ncbi:Hg(II)-responsive transcriptional regulator [Bacillaceae bacterium S4-13-58]
MTYQIGELADKCGVNKETIRYYERMNLIDEPSRTNSGYRMYREESIKRIQFIKRMQTFGFSLKEIYKLLGVVDKDGSRCADMYEFVSKKLLEVDQQIKELQKVSFMLSDLKERCPNEKELHECPIIDTIID